MVLEKIALEKIAIPKPMNLRSPSVALSASLLLVMLSSCDRSRSATVKAGEGGASQLITVATAPVALRPLSDHLNISSELVPFQEIDVYAKEAGYVKEIYVDYGSRVHKGQLMALLEIPELEAQLQQDQAAIKAQGDEVTRASHEVARVKAQSNVLKLQFERLAGVSKTQPGLVAQQEVDDAQGKELAAESQLEATQGSYAAAQSQLVVARARLTHDQALFDYSKITAPFDGVVTQRYANLGALMQAGTSNTQSTPLVHLAQENVFRLVIPVPETYVPYIRIGDPVEVKVPALNNQSYQGKVIRFSVDVTSDTRTMHTEVDVPNTNNKLIPGLYAEAVLTLNQKPNAVAIPIQAIDHEGDSTSVMLLQDDGTVARRPVTLGVQSPDYAEVARGLKPGQQVVVSDRTALKPGQHVLSHPAAELAYEGSNGQDPAQEKH
jgi:RND family efflux transporter MFP subunit